MITNADIICNRKMPKSISLLTKEHYMYSHVLSALTGIVILIMIIADDLPQLDILALDQDPRCWTWFQQAPSAN